jgi:hypothetical protein
MGIISLSLFLLDLRQNPPIQEKNIWWFPTKSFVILPALYKVKVL